MIGRKGGERRMSAIGVFAGAAALLLSGCGLTIPADPSGTRDAVTGGELRVGVSHEPGLVDAASDPPSGTLVRLVSGFADTLGAEPTWHAASEESLVRMLEDGEIDIAIGGFTSQSPWTEDVGATRPFAAGAADDVVMLVPAGENAFLMGLERYLDAEAG